jgi:hypothetical protein
MTIHGSPGTLDVVVRMLAGLWGEGKSADPATIQSSAPFDSNVAHHQHFSEFFSSLLMFAVKSAAAVSRLRLSPDAMRSNQTRTGSRSRVGRN